MLRVFVALVLAFNLVLFASNTDKKIHNERKNLSKTQLQEKLIHKKLNAIAKNIISEENSLKLKDKEIADLSEQIKALKSDSKATNIKLNRLSNENKKLAKTKKELEEKIINIIAEKFSFYLFTDQDYQESEESIMADEVLKSMDTILKKDFQNLSNTYEKTNKTIEEHNKQIKSIKLSLADLVKKQANLRKLKERRAKKVANLKLQKRAYRKKLDKIVAQRVELKKTLQKLKILKKQEDQERQNQKNYKKGTINKNVSVKQVGSSYQESKVKRYRGRKTIAPLKSFIVKQGFGNYIDPIYKIKIFNESVTLQSKIPNAKVRNVLSGKVIFAKDTAMLKKVIIIENRLGIHTIYAHLDKIAPTIKVGRVVKKGYVIGKVQSELSFEVTQKNYHINPLELIRH